MRQFQENCQKEGWADECMNGKTDHYTGIIILLDMSLEDNMTIV